MRASWRLAVLFLAGCGSSAAPASSAAPPSSAPPASAPVAPPAIPAPAVVAPPTSSPARAATPARAPTPAELRAQLAQLREARAAVAAHDYPRALATFDAMLHATPRAPRVLCEAGYVAHLAGNERLAASRIDLALTIFGTDAELAADTRVPVAMCLFNRGLVAEAMGDAATARLAYARSQTLRPNASVRRHLDALGAPPADEDDDSVRVAGIAVTEGERALRVATTEASTIERVLASGLSGEDWDGLPVEASVSTVAHATATGAITEVSVSTIDDGSAMLANTSLAISLRARDATWVVWTSVGSYDSTDHGHSGGCDGGTPTLTVEGDLLLVTYDVECSESSMGETDPPADHPDASCYVTDTEESTTESHAIVCRLEPDPHCVHLDLASAITGHGSHDVYCEEDGHEIDTAIRTAPDDEEPLVETSAEATLADGQLHVTLRAGATETHRDQSFEQLHGDERIEVPTLLDDAAREAAEGEDEGDESEE